MYEMSETLLERNVKHHYLENNYNCAETMIQACNDTFKLDLPAFAYRMLSGFGSGLYTGNICGALVGCTSALSLMMVETRAHDTEYLPYAQRLLVRNFRNLLGETQCARLKVVHHTKEQRCLPTCLLAAQAMTQTVNQLQQEGLLKQEYDFSKWMTDEQAKSE